MSAWNASSEDSVHNPIVTKSLDILGMFQIADICLTSVFLAVPFQYYGPGQFSTR